MTDKQFPWKSSLLKHNEHITPEGLHSSFIKISQVCNKTHRMTEATAWGNPVNRAHFICKNGNEKRSVIAVVIMNKRSFITVN